MPIIAYIGLGSNEGDRKRNCWKAIDLLETAGRVGRVSSFYCADPVGYQDQGEFINAVVELETELSPVQLLRVCKRIEDELGRSRAGTVRWGPRTIDLDILLYGDRVVLSHDPELTIPHPLLAERRFALEPLAELAPRLTHPVQGKTIQQLLRGLRKHQRVERCDP